MENDDNKKIKNKGMKKKKRKTSTRGPRLQDNERMADTPIGILK